MERNVAEKKRSAWSDFNQLVCEIVAKGEANEETITKLFAAIEEFKKYNNENLRRTVYGLVKVLTILEKNNRGEQTLELYRCLSSI